jgi:soluble lytic murein transglycosylase-like protein
MQHRRSIVTIDFLKVPVLEALRQRILDRMSAALNNSAGGGSQRVTSPAAFKSLVAAAANRYQVPQQLVEAVIKVESNFNSQAVSSVGAKGLMQLMDGTAESLGVRNSFDPAQNIEGGVMYLRQMIDKFGSVPLALAAYNAGPGAVCKYGGVPPYAETQRYVKQVMSLAGNDWEA